MKMFNNRNQSKSAFLSLQKAARLLDLAPGRQEVIRSKVLSAIRIVPQAIPEPGTGLASRRLIWLPRFSMVVLVGIGVLGGTVYASGWALPGDVLYPVKLAKERVELGLAAQGEPKALVVARHAEERLSELSILKVEENNTASDIRKQPANEQQEVRREADVQVRSAINTLLEVKKQLESQGNQTAAASVDGALTRLITKAKSADIEIEKEIGSTVKHENQEDAEASDKPEVKEPKRPKGEVKGLRHKAEDNTRRPAGKIQDSGAGLLPVSDKGNGSSTTTTSSLPIFSNDSPLGQVLGIGTSSPAGEDNLATGTQVTEPQKQQNGVEENNSNQQQHDQESFRSGK